MIVIERLRIGGVCGKNKNSGFIGEVDILRGILCIMLLIIHTTATPSIALKLMSLSSIIFPVLNIATKVAVPGFIFISGLTLSYRYRDLDNIIGFILKD